MCWPVHEPSLVNLHWCFKSCCHTTEKWNLWVWVMCQQQPGVCVCVWCCLIPTVAQTLLQLSDAWHFSNFLFFFSLVWPFWLQCGDTAAVTVRSKGHMHAHLLTHTQIRVGRHVFNPVCARIGASFSPPRTWEGTKVQIHTGSHVCYQRMWMWKSLFF